MPDPGQVQLSKEAITLRVAEAEDFMPLVRLAALDSARPPRPPVLIAEVGGEIRAAISMADGRAIADPFTHSDQLVALARMLAAGGENA